MKTVFTAELFNNNLLTVFVVDKGKHPRVGEEFIFGGRNGDQEVYKVVRFQNTRMQEFINTTAPSQLGRTGPNPNIPVPLPEGKIGLASRKSGKRTGIVQK